MHAQIHFLFAALLLGGCASASHVPEKPAPSKPAVDAVTTATPEVKKKTQDPRKVTAQQIRARLAAMPQHPRLFIANSSALARNSATSSATSWRASARRPRT